MRRRHSDFYDKWLCNVPDEVMDKDFCIKAVKHRGNNISFVPDSFLNEYLCILAIGNGATIEDVPEKWRTSSVIAAAVAHGSLVGIPSEDITYDMACTAIAANPQEIRRCPRQLRDERLYCMAIRKDYELYSLVPVGERNQAIYEALMQAGGSSLRTVPKEERSYEICRLAISKAPWEYAHVPEQIRMIPETREWAIEAIGRYGSRQTLNAVPSEFVREVLLEVYRRSAKGIYKCPLMLTTVSPERYWFPDVVMEYIRFEPESLEYFHGYKSREMCVEAVRRCGRMIGYVPTEYIDYELICMAIDQDVWNMRHIPRKREFLEMAIRRNGQSVHYLPPKLVDMELCKLALSNPDPGKCADLERLPTAFIPAFRKESGKGEKNDG